MKIRNQLVVSVAAIAAAAVCALFSRSASAQVTVFDDTFSSGSTLDSATPAAPTASSTDYEVASSKPTTNANGQTGSALTISPGDLHLTFSTTTTSGAEEIQALFTSSPVDLTSVGDYVQLAITFYDTTGVVCGGTSQLDIGLYNSGGVAPLAGGPLSNGGLNLTLGSPYATNGTSLWSGYVGSMNVGNNSQINVRQPQTSATYASANQDLLFNGAFSGAYNNPKGPTLHSALAGGTGIIDTTNGVQYTDVLLAQLTASGLLISNTWYIGANTAGPIVFANGNITNGLTSAEFDGLGFGYYMKGEAVATNPVADVSEVLVTTNIPEPSTWMLLAAGLAMLAGLVRRQRS
jgi:hypothetical protein